MTVNLAQSQGLYTTICRRDKSHNSSLLTMGVVDIDIPQHPGVLHGVVSRSSKRLSSTLQEFIRPMPKIKWVSRVSTPTDILLQDSLFCASPYNYLLKSTRALVSLCRSVDATDSNLTAFTGATLYPPTVTESESIQQNASDMQQV